VCVCVFFFFSFEGQFVQVARNIDHPYEDLVKFAIDKMWMQKNQISVYPFGKCTEIWWFSQIWKSKNWLHFIIFKNKNPFQWNFGREKKLFGKL